MSNYTLQATALTTTATWYEFWLPTHSTCSNSTVYHLVAQYTGSVDASNYVKLSATATGTFTQSQHSANGSSWTANGNAISYQIMVGNFECISPAIYNNWIVASNASTTLATHNCIPFECQGCSVYGNVVIGGGLIGFKLDDGDGAYTSTCYNNLIIVNRNNGGSYKDKGSLGTRFYDDAVIGTGGNNITSVYAYGDLDVTNPPEANGQASKDCVVQGCLFYQDIGGGTTYNVILGTGTGTLVNLSMDYDTHYYRQSVLMANDDRTGSNTAVNTFSGFQALSGTGLSASPEAHGVGLTTGDIFNARTSGPPGVAGYMVLKNISGQYWNASTQAWETYNAGHWAQYAHPMQERTQGFYVMVLPLSAGACTPIYYYKSSLTAAPSPADVGLFNTRSIVTNRSRTTSHSTTTSRSTVTNRVLLH